MIFVGDMLKFQNGFSGWANMIYECTWDWKSKKTTFRECKTRKNHGM